MILYSKKKRKQAWDSALAIQRRIRNAFRVVFLTANVFIHLSRYAPRYIWSDVLCKARKKAKFMEKENVWRVTIQSAEKAGDADGKISGKTLFFSIKKSFFPFGRVFCLCWVGRKINCWWWWSWERKRGPRCNKRWAAEEKWLPPPCQKTCVQHLNYKVCNTSRENIKKED